MAAVESAFDTLDDALRATSHHQSLQDGHPASRPAARAGGWRNQRKQAFSSVFQTDITQPTPNATPIAGFTAHGQPFGVPDAAAANKSSFAQSQDSEDLDLPDANDEGLQDAVATAGQPAPASDGNDQFRFDRAWHAVTARISLPSSVAVEDSFGTLAPESQLPSSQDAATEAEFNEAVRLVFNARTLLPRASHTDDILFWHTHQVRHHYTQHVLPMLSACVGEAPAAPPRQGETATLDDQRYYEHHMAVVVNSIRTLEAAFRLYFYGLMLLVRGIRSAGGSPLVQNPDAIVSRFRQDVNALVANSTPKGLTESIRVVFTRYASVFLGFESPRKLDDSNVNTTSSSQFIRRSAQGAPISPTRQRSKLAVTPSAPPRPLSLPDSRIDALQKEMLELLQPLHDVGLAGENFQILFAEILDEKMIDFIQLSFAGRWGETNPKLLDEGSPAGSLAALKYWYRNSRKLQAPSFCIGVVYDWIGNHFAPFARRVMGKFSPLAGGAVPDSDVDKWKEVALGRLSMLRMTELFDIVLHWPQSREGLEDLRVSVTTSQRRSQLVSTFSAEMQKRLIHPACSTLEIMQVYVAMIRTFHVLDPSNVLLSSAVAPLQFCLCQREDAVRIMVDGLLADPEASHSANGTVADKIAKTRAASSALPVPGSASSNLPSCKLDELATILNDPMQHRRRHVDEEELDWDDMEWMPDPIDAGTNYRRPKNEDVIGTLIGALGSREAFTKEFQSIIAERLLSTQNSFVKEVKVLDLLKKRFGEGSMQNCEVMIKDIRDSHLLNAHIDPQINGSQSYSMDEGPASTGSATYNAKILSRLYWPGLDQEAFLLPKPIAEKQEMYASLFEQAREGRKLSWLNQLGRASVELELEDRTVSLECKTYEATVIYAFQGSGKGQENDGAPAHQSLWDLVEMLRMDEDLVALALTFWEKQGVLRQDAEDAEKYHVIENLAAAAAADAKADKEGDASGASGASGASAEPAAAAAPADTQKTRKARSDDAQRTVYWQFINGMLTNSAASMPLAQIAMMMKMLIAEGFPWSNEELQDFLAEKIEDGDLEVVGGKYKRVKK